MKLRKKTLIIISMTIISLIAILYATSQIILLNSFAKLEEHNTNQNVERVLSALFDDVSNLDTITFDWAAWDDTYAFVEDLNTDYIESNLVNETFIGSRLNLMLFINSSGHIVYGKAFDLQNETEIPVPQSFLELLSVDDLLWRHPDTNSSVNGIVLLPEDPMLIASRPILTSEEEGPIRGALIMGRYLDSEEINSLAEKTHLSLIVHRFNDSQLPSDFQAALSYLSDEKPILTRPLDADSVAGYALIKDVYGTPSLVLRTDMPRDIYKQGQASISYFMLLLLAAGVVFGVVTMLLLEEVVLSRLAQLSANVGSIGASGDLSTRVSMTGRDELSSLADAINGMLAALEQAQGKLRHYSEHLEELVKERTKKLRLAQEQLLKAERMAAIGEVAAMVGHDLKNPLQSIENATYYLNNELPRLPSTQIPQKAIEMLQIINDSVNYADRVIKDLHDFSATKKPILKKTDVNAIVKETLSKVEVPKNVELITELGHLPRIEADKDMVERVFLNLAVNGIQAMESGGRLKVSTKKTRSFVEVSFKDTGVGMPKENMERLFTPFFTTRAKGMGMGLSVCKKFVDAHGGSIEVESKEGKGSTFTVKLPIQ